MGIELYDYQLDAIKRLENGHILCGGVGSGKSRTAIAYYYLKVCHGKLRINGVGNYEMMKIHKNLYIITTAQKRDKKEWENECTPFLLSHDKRISVVVDSWNNIKKYSEVKDAFFIFDEDRIVGNGAWVKAFLKIAKNNLWILLSATPGDKWEDYIAVFVANGFYKNKTEFKREHIVYSPYCKNFPKVDHYVNTRKLERLRHYILVDMNFKRRTISHDEKIFLDYDRTKYLEVYKKRWDIFKDEPIVNASGLCYVLRRIVNDDPSRIETVEKIARMKDKLIIFYNFDYELEKLRDATYVQGTTVAEWNGHKHEPIPNSDRWVYLVQYTAGAEGWNCIETDTIIFYSQNYSYKVMQQSRGRIDRLNTPFQDLYYYHLVSRAPIDQAIRRALNEKKKFNERAFAYF